MDASQNAGSTPKFRETHTVREPEGCEAARRAQNIRREER